MFSLVQDVAEAIAYTMDMDGWDAGGARFDGLSATVRFRNRISGRAVLVKITEDTEG